MVTETTMEIIIALISFGGSVIGSFAGIMISAKLTRYRVEQLEKKVEKHNNVITRTFKLEEGQAVIREQLKIANHRLADLERED